MMGVAPAGKAPTNVKSAVVHSHELRKILDKTEELLLLENMLASVSVCLSNSRLGSYLEFVPSR